MAVEGRVEAVNARTLGLSASVLAIGLWWLISLGVPSYLAPGPPLVAAKLWEFCTDPNLAIHVGASLLHVLIAMPIAFVLGSGLAILAHDCPVTHLMVHGRIAPFLNSFSSIGWTMLAILWLGLDGTTVVFAITAIILPVSIVNIRAGLDTLDGELAEMGQSFGRRWRDNFFLLVLPALLPFMFAAIRISFGIAWKVALTAELFGGNSGLGFVVNLARQSFDTAQIFAVIAIIVLIAILSDNFILAPLQARLSRQYADG